MLEIDIVRKKADFGVSRRHIGHVLAEEAERHSIEFDRDSLKGSKNTVLGKLTGLKHSFEIESGADAYVVTETISVSLVWHLLWLFPFLFISFYSSIWLQQVFWQVPRPLLVLFAVLTAVLPIIWITSIAQQVTLLTETRSQNQTQEVESSITNLLPVITCFLAVSCLLTRLAESQMFLINTILSISSIATIGGSLIILLGFQNLSQIYFKYNIFDRVPSSSTELAATALVSAAPAAFLVFNQGMILTRNQVNTLTTGIGFLSQQIGLILLSSASFGYLTGFIRSSGLEQYYSFVEDSRDTSRRPTRIVTAIGFTVISYSVIYTGLRVLQIHVLSDPIQHPMTTITAVFTLIPILYFPAGIAYQTAIFIKHISRLFNRSRPVSLPFETGAEIREWMPPEDVDEEIYWAGSFTTGFNNYIFISQGAVKGLRKDELQALILHEQQHIESGEALLSSYIPVISLATFVGRNIFYSLVDYRSREFEADQAAAQEVGSDSVVSVLNKFSEAQRKSAGAPVTGAFSFGGEFAELPDIQKYFNLFFGEYAVREAHPDVEDRIERIRESYE